MTSRQETFQNTLYIQSPAERERQMLRRSLLEVQNSASLSERQKAAEMQKIMTRNYYGVYVPAIAVEAIGSGEPLSSEDRRKTFHDEGQGILGCRHYQRSCKLQCSQCYAWATCRFCHNEEHPDHELIRTATKMMMCMCCTIVQPAAQHCQACSTRLALYYCGKCKLWDDDQSKNIYHCQDCGICRVGHGLGKDFFRKFHPNANSPLTVRLQQMQCMHGHGTSGLAQVHASDLPIPC